MLLERKVVMIREKCRKEIWKEISEDADTTSTLVIFTYENLRDRQDFVIKNGVQKMWSDLDMKIVDRKDGKTLFSMLVAEGKRGKFLRTVGNNGSSVMYHVGDECKDVGEAIGFAENNVVETLI